MDGRAAPTTEELNGWAQAVAATASRTAFASLFAHFAPRIKGFLVRAGSDEALAEEIAQEAMVVLWRRASSFDPSRGQLSTWLFTIARNLRIDHDRRRATPAPGDGEPWDADQQPASLDLAPEALLLAAQRERGVREALAELPAEQALVLRLSFYEEHPHSRIAQDLDIPLGTVKSRVRLAMAQLRRILEGIQS
jgi:RNA polymerase sigma-70 factor (ECF subfamily)